jgi:hypothetical protein
MQRTSFKHDSTCAQNPRERLPAWSCFVTRHQPE